MPAKAGKKKGAKTKQPQATAEKNHRRLPTSPQSEPRRKMLTIKKGKENKTDNDHETNNKRQKNHRKQKETSHK